MNTLRTTLKNGFRDQYFISETYRRFVLRRALQQVTPSTGRELTATTVENLIYGWGNHPWSAKQEFIQAMVQAAWQVQGPILDCGSGLSTLLLGVVAQQTGQRVWSLENNPFWANKVREALARYRIDNVDICLAELRNHKSYSWYAAPKDRMPTNFALVVCDGPPGHTFGGRYGLLPEMRAHFKPGCIILLDDAERSGEQEVLIRWSRELGNQAAKLGSVKAYGRLMIPGTSMPAARSA